MDKIIKAFILVICLFLFFPQLASATIIPYTITTGIPGYRPHHNGITFFETDLSINFQSGNIVLSSKHDSTGNTIVDDAIRITVIGPDNITRTYTHYYNNGCWSLSDMPPADITNYFRPGINQVHIKLFDVCGISVGSSSLYLANTNAPDPTPTPTPISTPTPTPSKTPLIFIPGIGGSELKVKDTYLWTAPDGHGGTYTHTYPAEEKVWVNEGEAIMPGNDDYFDILRLQSDGQTSEANLELTDNIFAGAYHPTIDFFTTNGYTLNQNFFVFPYDWRKDVSLTAPLLDQKIEAIKTQTGSQKVDLVAHSMGGLVARNYIADPIKAQKVRKLITLGTPYLGAVDFLKNLMYGGCLRFEAGPFCLSLAPSEIKDVLQNMVGGFELAPSQKYFNFYSGEDELHSFPFRDERDIDTNGITGPLNYAQTKTLLTNLGYNTPLFDPTETFHGLDNNLPNTNGVDVSIIVGSGIDTLGQIIEKNRIDFAGIKIPYKDMVKINGDETVPLLSASLSDPHKNLFLNGNATIYYTKQKHSQLVFNGPAMDMVKTILGDSNLLSAGISLEPYKLDGHEFSVHSPVNIHAYDQLRNHTGPLPNGDFEVDIPESSYDTLDDAKFIFLPDDGIYTLEFEVTDNGSFDFKIRDYKNDINDKTILYKSVPLTNTTKAETVFDTNSTEPPILQVDTDGNGTIDSQVNNSAILTGDANYDNTSPTITINFPIKDAVLILNQPVTADFQCNDENSDIDKCQGIINAGENIDTSSVGTKEFKVFAEDRAGNTTLQTITYKVQYSSGTCLGNSGHTILQPINNDGTSIFKQGSTVPAKFRVCNNNGISVGTLGVINNFSLISTVSETTINSVNDPVDSTTPEVSFRWDATNQQWIFNMNTKTLSAGKTYFYKINLNDGTIIEFSFGLK